MPIKKSTPNTKKFASLDHRLGTFILSHVTWKSSDRITILSTIVQILQQASTHMSCHMSSFSIAVLKNTAMIAE